MWPGRTCTRRWRSGWHRGRRRTSSRGPAAPTKPAHTMTSQSVCPRPLTASWCVPLPDGPRCIRPWRRASPGWPHLGARRARPAAGVWAPHMRLQGCGRNGGCADLSADPVMRPRPTCAGEADGDDVGVRGDLHWSPPPGPHCPPCISPTPAPTLTTTRPEVLPGACAAPGGRMDYTSQCLWH